LRASLVDIFEDVDLGPAQVRAAFRAIYDEVRHLDPGNADDYLSSAFYIVLAEASLKVPKDLPSYITHVLLVAITAVVYACRGGSVGQHDGGGLRLPAHVL
jgi:hypothetical protein